TERLVGSVPIQLRCSQPVAWTAYINVRFGVWREVLTACHSLPRNQTLVAQDLCPRQQSLATLRQHALFDAQEAEGMALKRAVTAGAVLYRSQLAPAITVTRGETLTIAAQRGQVLIQTSGKALGSGSNGQQIQVQNIRSGRKLAGWILGPGRVSTTPPQIREKTEINAKVLVGSVDSPAKNPAIAAE
ncbi:MAG: flagellar basal body P-ring formation chaperone FlgA, partial [Pseudomonadales bacterium]